MSRSVFVHRRRSDLFVGDTYNRGNGALGSTDSKQLSPLAYTVASIGGTAVIEVVSNQAKTTTSVSNDLAVAVVNLGVVTGGNTADYAVSALCTNNSGNGGSCVVGRYTDISNLWYMEQTLTLTRLRKREAGTTTTIVGSSPDTPVRGGIVFQGDTVSLYEMNADGSPDTMLETSGNVPITTTNSFNNTATRVGIGWFSNNNIPIDDLLVVQI